MRAVATAPGAADGSAWTDGAVPDRLSSCRLAVPAGGDATSTSVAALPDHRPAARAHRRSADRGAAGRRRQRRGRTGFVNGPVRALQGLLGGHFALRGSAVLVDGEALLIAGSSGAGKSALAATLMRSGSHRPGRWLCLREPGTPPTVRVSGTELGLWPDTVKALGMDGADGELVRPGLAKRAFAGPLPPTGPSVPVRRLVVLSIGAPRGGDGAVVEPRPLDLPAAMRTDRRARVPGPGGRASRPERRPRPLAHVARLVTARRALPPGRGHGGKPDGAGPGGPRSMRSLAPTIWLASYPKSGNTWLRAMYSAWSAREEARLDRLDGVPMAASRQAFDDALGIDSADLTADEIDLLRPRADEVIAAQDRRDGEIRLRKVHDALFTGPAGEPVVSVAAARCAVYVIRDPRDVAVSLAHHTDRAPGLRRRVHGLAERRRWRPPRDRLEPQLRQRLGTWSEHVESWTDQETIPVARRPLRRLPARSRRRLVDRAGFRRSAASRPTGWPQPWPPAPSPSSNARKNRKGSTSGLRPTACSSARADREAGAPASRPSWPPGSRPTIKG